MQYPETETGFRARAYMMGVPVSTIDCIANYIYHRVPPGGFLGAVLENNLMESMCRADDQNRPRLWEICALLYNYAPRDCWRSIENVKAWIEAGREDLCNSTLT